MGLSRKQDLARTGGDYVRVIAGPGSGKTTLLVARTKFLLQQAGSVVGLVTFAKPAAQEMRERLSVSVDINRVRVSTFDAFARQQFLPHLDRRRPPKYFERQIILQRAINETALDFTPEDAEECVNALDTMLHPEQHTDEDAVLLFETYQELMEEDGLIDFSEVARQVVIGMMADEIEPIPVTHLLVDEFQDTAPVQLAWLREHWRRGVKVTVVGDDDQSIYGFRSAMGNEGMNQFASQTNAEDFYLDECYRCAPEIVALSGKVIENNFSRIPKKIKSMAQPGGVVTHGMYDEMEDQCKALCEWIEEIRAERSDATVGILARTNRGLDDIEAMLRIAEYKYRRIGGKSIWDSQGAGLLLGLAELATFRTHLEAPSAANALSWAGVPHGAVEDYRQHIVGNGLFAELGPSLAEDGRIASLHGQLAMWANMIIREQDSPALNLIAAWIKDHARMASDHKTARIAARALSNPESKATLAQRIRSVTMNRSKADESDPSVIDIATMHGAKGMEWNAVWVSGADEPGVPSKQALETEANGSIHLIEEERRLFYVAMTRAKNWLHLATNKHPSRFVVEAGLCEPPKENSKAQRQAEIEEG